MKTYCLVCQKESDVDDKTMPCPQCGLRTAGLEDVAAKLPPYESEAAREIVQWLNRPPGAIASVVNKIIDGIVDGGKAIVPEKVAEDVANCLVGLLDLLQNLSFYTWISDEEELRRDLEARLGKGELADVLADVIPLVSGKGVVQQAADLGYDAKAIGDLRGLSLEQVDKIVAQYMTLTGNKALAVAEGGLTGLGGFALLVVDIPVLTAINFRYVQQIASCFGYDQDSTQEKIFTMRVFLLAFGGDLGLRGGTPARIAAAYELKSLAYALAEEWTYAQMAEKAVLTGLLAWMKKTAPSQLAKVVAKRKAAAAIPVLGAGISATINYAITSYTGKVAWYCYKYRKLLERFGGLEGEDMPATPLLPEEGSSGDGDDEVTAEE